MRCSQRWAGSIVHGTRLELITVINILTEELLSDNRKYGSPCRLGDYA
jgi:hypothetical protein